MSKPPYRPLNLKESEITFLKLALEGLLEDEHTAIKTSHVGRIGAIHLQSILMKVTKAAERI